MPAKKQPQPTKKAEAKQKAKIIEDKTFGLKNKNKSTKVQKYVQQVQKTVNDAGKKKKPQDAVPKKSKKELEQEKKEELTQLFKVTQSRVPKGVDPKSVLCEYFKNGLCTKGDKCKFSHDLQVARKVEKIDLYTDRREAGDDKGDMESGGWTQDKLEEVVKAKEEKAGRKIHSDIVCKHFIEAVEMRKYGWFWVCPNGGEECQYRHALPPGYQLKEKTKVVLDEDKPEEPSVEEVIEEERRKLTTRTPLTLELFKNWRQQRAKRKEAEKAEASRRRNLELHSGSAQMSGREMFEFKPELFVDDDEAFVADDYVGKPEDREPVHEVILEATGTSLRATVKRHGEATSVGEDGVPIDESLFDGDMIDDIPDEDGDGNGGNHSDGEGEENGEHEDGDDEQDEEEEEGDEEEEGEEEEDEAAGSPSNIAKEKEEK